MTSDTATIRHAFIATPVDRLLLVAEGDELVGLYFENYAYTPGLSTIGPRVGAGDDPLLSQTERELAEYFAGERRDFEVPTRTSGDDFQEAVWEELTRIPYGETVSYGSIATTLGSLGLSQRVGQTVGRNPVSIIIPCHRVVGADGSLTGFGGGLRRKQILLELEEPDDVKASRLF